MSQVTHPKKNVFLLVRKELKWRKTMERIYDNPVERWEGYACEMRCTGNNDRTGGSLTSVCYEQKAPSFSIALHRQSMKLFRLQTHAGAPIPN